jgi:spoIIIJ-associated protein
MEWVETTGRTVEEALDNALDQLGVDGADAEYEIIEEPKTGLFGRLRNEARVRARVRPTTPRPKEDRRSRGRKTPRSESPASSETTTDVLDGPPPKRSRPEATASRSPQAEKRTRSDSARSSDKPRRTDKDDAVTDTDPDVPLATQGEVAADFVRGVLERFGAPGATVSTHELDEDTLEVRVDGGDLGLLIGPKGAALQSLQELTRTVVQRQTGARSGRILVDVSGYRQRRKEALERFARKVADDVLASSSRVVLEPMNPADRKVIHDTINNIDGVATSSEGEEPRRRVVVSPT